MTQALRAVLVTAVLLIIPLTEASHAMPLGGSLPTASHQMADMHDMGMLGKMPASHSADLLSCGIMCLGWPQTAEAVRHEAPALALIVSMPIAQTILPEGIPLAPGGRPPKSALI